MSAEVNVALDCPNCGESIYKTLSWFKKPYSTCPNCQNGLAAGQFAATIAELERAMDENIEEMLYGSAPRSCCGKDSCGC